MRTNVHEEVGYNGTDGMACGQRVMVALIDNNNYCKSDGVASLDY